MPITQAMLPQLISTFAKSGDAAAQAGAEAEMQDQKNKQQMALEKFLKGSVDQGGNYTPGVEAKAQEATDQQRRQAFTDQLKDPTVQSMIARGYGVTFPDSGGGLSKPANLGMQSEKLKEGKEEGYSKRLEKYSDAGGALQAIEGATNVDGKGGVLTNPDAKLKSFGPFASMMSDQAVAIAESLGRLPPGAAEERKTISRYKLALGHALTGARMNPSMQKQIQDSLGQLSSNDPQLVAKGLRGSAKLLGNTINTTEAGYTPDVTGAVNTRLGGDPMEFYNSVYQDGPAGGVKTPPAAPPAGSTQSPPAAPQTKKIGNKTYMKNPKTGMWDEQ